MAQEENKITEIANGMTVEEMNALYMADGLIEPMYKVFQLNSKGHRYYYRYNENGDPEFYPSVTTILHQTMPTPPHLIKWIADMGYEEADAYKNERAHYGTFMHAQYEKLIINRSYDLDALNEELKKYMEINKLPSGFINYADDLKKDVLAFAQFVIDYDVRPLAVEIALIHPEHKYAGMIDLPCRMREKIGSDKYINAIVDFKSGKKGFFEAHEIQLFMYADMWNVNYPDTPIERVFNFAPKDWREKPTYHLTEQTDKPSRKKVAPLLAIASIEDEKIDNTFMSVGGIVNLGESNADADLTANIVSLTLSEIVKGKKEKTPEEGIEIEDEATKARNTAKKVKKTPTTKRKTADLTTTPPKRKKRADGKTDKNN